MASREWDGANTDLHNPVPSIYLVASQKVKSLCIDLKSTAL